MHHILFVRLRISPARIKLAASNVARWFIGVQGRESPILGNFAPPEAQNRTNRCAAASITNRGQSHPLTARSSSVEGTGDYRMPSAYVPEDGRTCINVECILGLVLCLSYIEWIISSFLQFMTMKLLQRPTLAIRFFFDNNPQMQMSVNQSINFC